MASNSTKSGASGLSKWQFALLVGTPVAAGLAYWYYVRSNSKKGTPDTNSKGQLKSSNLKSSESNLAKGAEANQNAGKKERDTKVESGITSKDPFERAKAFKNQGNKYFKEGKFDKAINCYTEAIQICPQEKTTELATFYQNRAASYENLKNFREVINDCSKAIELNNTYVKALHRRAKAYEVVEELQKCLEDITAVCILEGFQNQNSLLVTDRVLKKQGKIRAKDVLKTRVPCLPSKHFIRNYFISFCEDPVMKTVQKYKEEKMENQNSAELSGYRLAIHRLAEEKYDDVIPHCTHEIEREGTELAEALLVRGTFYYLQGQQEDTLNDLNRIIAMESVDVKVRVNAYIKIGTLKVHAEQMTEALVDFDKAIELDSNNADIYLHRGQVFLLLDRTDETLKDMEKSVALNPSFPSAIAQKYYIQYRCGVRYNDTKQKEAAMTGFLNVQKQFPDCSECYFLYAQLLTEINEFEKAEEYFKKAGEIDPTDPNVYVHLGILQLQWKQDIDKAISFLNKAIELDDKSQFAYETLGSIEVQRGFLQQGLELFEKAIALAQTETELAHLFALRDAAEAQGRVAVRLGIQIGQGAS